MRRTRRQNDGPPLADLGEVVRRDDGEVARGEVEEVAAHESAGEDVTAGEALDLGLVEAPSAGLLGAHQEPGAAQPGDLGGVGVVPAGHQKPVWRGDRVPAEVGGPEQPLKNQQQDRLAVGACAEQERQDVLADLSDEGQPGEPLHVPDEFVVAVESLGEERRPPRVRCVDVHACRRRPGEEQARVVRTDVAGPQVDDTAQGVEQQWVCVEIGGSHRNPRVGLGDPDGAADPCGGQAVALEGLGLLVVLRQVPGEPAR